MKLLTLIILFLQLFKFAVGSISNDTSDHYYPIWDEIRNATSDAQFVDELTRIAKHASSLRDGNPSGHFVNYTAGYNGILGRFCFEDDMCWAAKISLQHNRYYRIGMRHAVRTLMAIATYCPALPVPRVHGYSIDSENATFCYYFMD